MAETSEEADLVMSLGRRASSWSASQLSFLTGCAVVANATRTKPPQNPTSSAKGRKKRPRGQIPKPDTECQSLHFHHVAHQAQSPTAR